MVSLHYKISVIAFGCDENLSKKRRRQRRPLENLILVDADHENLSLIDVYGQRSTVNGRRRPH